MSVDEIISPEQEYLPTSSQLERMASIRRFNLLFVYLPIGVISLVGLAMVVILLYLALFRPTQETMETISGYADAITILGTLPLLLLCAVVPTLVIVVTIQARKNNTAPIRRLQKLMWQLDSRLRSIDRPLTRITQIITKPLISIKATFAFIQTLFRQILGLVRRG